MWLWHMELRAKTFQTKYVKVMVSQAFKGLLDETWVWKIRVENSDSNKQ